MPEKLNFLTSRKFWALIAIAVIEVLRAEGIITNEIANPLVALLYGFIGINLVGKATEVLKK
jgi:tRNA(His) 5'-end guanylyltransferase